MIKGALNFCNFNGDFIILLGVFSFYGFNNLINFISCSIVPFNSGNGLLKLLIK